MDERRHREVEDQLWRGLGVRRTERFVELDRSGARVRVQESGEGDPVVFVHGGSVGGSC